jgi:hypothetical protein
MLFGSWKCKIPHVMEHFENMFELVIVTDQPVRDLSPGFYDQARNLDKSMDKFFEFHAYNTPAQCPVWKQQTVPCLEIPGKRRYGWDRGFNSQPFSGIFSQPISRVVIQPLIF